MWGLRSPSLPAEGSQDAREGSVLPLVPAKPAAPGLSCTGKMLGGQHWLLCREVRPSSRAAGSSPQELLLLSKAAKLCSEAVKGVSPSGCPEAGA